MSLARSATAGSGHRMTISARSSVSAFSSCLFLLTWKPMNKDDLENLQETETHQPAYRVRLPGFLLKEEIGLGDAV
jgi:hypothetical protein